MQTHWTGLHNKHEGLRYALRQAPSMAAGVVSSPAVRLGSTLGVGQCAMVLVEVVLVCAVLAHHLVLLLPAECSPPLSVPAFH